MPECARWYVKKPGDLARRIYNAWRLKDTSDVDAMQVKSCTIHRSLGMGLQETHATVKQESVLPR